MAQYRRESHIRSILKGISWRFIATSDLIIIVLVVTCLQGQCSLENAIKIGAVEFLIKLFVYYIHERIWQNYRKGEVSKKQTLYKTISWRIIATTMTFVITGTVLEGYNEIALIVALTELITKFALYYLHERLWLKLPLGRIRNYVYKLIGKN